MHQFLLIIAVILTWSTASAQEKVSARDYWGDPILSVSQADGLPDLYVKDYLEDQHGFIWIATHSGITRFDGSTLVQVKIDTMAIDLTYTSMIEDRQRQQLWISNMNGVHRYDLLRNTITARYNIASRNNWGPGLSNTLFLDRNDHLWVGQNEGFSVVDLQTDSVWSAKISLDDGRKTPGGLQNIHSIIQDPTDDNVFWFGTGAGLLKYQREENNSTWYDTRNYGYGAPGIGHYLFYSRIGNNLIMANDRSTNDPGRYNFMVFDLFTEKFIGGIELHAEWRVRGIFNGPDNRIWLSTDQGIASYNPVTHNLETTISSLNSTDFPLRIDFVDSKGRFWSNGLKAINVYSPSAAAVTHNYYETAFMKGYHVCTDIHVENGKIFMAVFGGDGVYAFDPENGTWQTFPPHPDLNHDGIFYGTGIVRTSKGELLALSNHGLFKIGKNYLEKILLSQTAGLGEGALDLQNDLWTKQKNRLVRINLQDNTSTHYPNEFSECHNKLRAFKPKVDPDGNVWLLGMCEGFSVYMQTENRFIHSRKLKIYDALPGFIQDVAFKDNLAYLLNESMLIGILELSTLSASNRSSLPDSEETAEVGSGRQNTGAQFSDLRYNRTINLNGKVPETTIVSPTSATIDSEGILWVLTSTGLIRVDPITEHVEVFEEDDGIITKDRELGVAVAEHVIMLDDQTLVYSGRKSLHIVKTKMLRSQKVAPSAYISSLLVNNTQYESDTAVVFKKHYTLNPKENYLTFEFSALEFNRPHLTQFAHQLLGVDEHWIESKRRNVTYSYLPGGDYTFQLKARHGQGIWGSVASHQIKIRKIWYQTLVAKILFLVALLSGAYRIYRTRIRRAIEKQRLMIQHERALAEVKMNALTAQMNPHFIFNSLNSIDYFIIKNDRRKASDYLNRFARLIRLILNHSRSNYISLKDDLEALQLYIEIENLRFDNKFDYIVKTDKHLDLNAVQIPPMLFQPYVENAIWHGLMHKKDKGCLAVNVSLDATGQAVIGIIEDNGIGRQKAGMLKSKSAHRKARKSMGMAITSDKLELINSLHNLNATSEIEDLVDQNGKPTGTRVTLTIPI